MTSSIVKIILGLFIWMVLPSMIIKGKKNKPMFKFVSISCLLLGILIIVYGVVGLLSGVLNINF
jgi:hypothetical protein